MQPAQARACVGVVSNPAVLVPSRYRASSPHLRASSGLPAQPLMRWAVDEDRTKRLGGAALADGSEEQPCELSMSATSDDEQIGAP